MAQKYKLEFFFPNENACFYKISNDTALYRCYNMLINDFATKKCWQYLFCG
jgi:hypothetical protein